MNGYMTTMEVLSMIAMFLLGLVAMELLHRAFRWLYYKIHPKPMDAERKPMISDEEMWNMDYYGEHGWGYQAGLDRMRTLYEDLIDDGTLIVAKKP